PSNAEPVPDFGCAPAPRAPGPLRRTLACAAHSPPQDWPAKRRLEAMHRVVRRSRSTGAISILALAAGLSTGALALAAGGGVTFTNASSHRVEVYTRYGGSSCDNAPTAKKVVVEAGQSSAVDSGDSQVCFCLTVPERGTCGGGGWLQAPAGSTQRLQ